ncbi:Retinoic acid induced 16-like protein-domain-containing protein [Rhodofomes roseus]|uniref:Retinoic acid induced 16-like protein-domain-containing protein n=1 Tax=Rhodofomes roseus TaxID=34475 RepID=A0ABQ8KUW0_9APHY|nr:Retinoic acid induced 16-like protein-domain-containing protein [Rhodofomes roseus]KAH9842774.1 Retinoic acid induced 16-like protein-domain-containing protein [Rhodofomes roseus]
MDYFSKFLRSTTQPSPKVEVDHAQEFHKSWVLIKNTLIHPDERQLSRGIESTDVPAHLQSMVDSLVWESTRTEEGATGACLEYLLKNDVLGTLVKLSESDRPFGTQAEVLRAVQNMVVLLDEQFLVHSAVHKAVLRLLRNCVGDDIQEQLDGRNKVMGAAGNAVRGQPSEYEEDLVNLLCILCSRIRTYRELLMIFFHDKHWYHPEPLFAVEEEDEDEEDEDAETLADQDAPEPASEQAADASRTPRPGSPSPSQETASSAPASSVTKKPEYEFLLFNYLLRFVHREGRIGDFARAGLLFLMDVAMSPTGPHNRSAGDGIQLSSSTSSLADSQSDPATDAGLALAEYIIDGDFSEVLAAGVSAVYSLLPSKLEVRPPAPAENVSGTAMVLGSSAAELSAEEKEKQEEIREKSRAMGVEDASSVEFKSRLDHFLKLLEFLQDVLRRNIIRETSDDSLDPSALVGSAIVQSILDAIRRVFLENVLYPSILECSDADGSAVAVMSYIDIMIRTLQNGQLADLLVDFLMSEDNTELARSRIRHQHQNTLTLNGNMPPVTRAPANDKEKKLRRRRSTAMVLLEMEAPDARRQSEYFTSMGRFTLKDLLLSSLRSKSQPTTTAALQLLQSLLFQYCQLCVDRLMVVIRDPYATSFPQPAALEALMPEKPAATEEDDEEMFVYPGAEDSPLGRSASPAPDSSMLFVQPDTTYWTHEREMGLYLTLVSRVDPNHNEDAFSTGYEHYLRDALLSIENSMCFQQDMDPEARSKMKHRLNPNDPVLSLVLESLRRFFSNTPEMNMALTGVLATLATCPDRSLAGWLTFAPKETDAGPNGASADSSVFTYGDDGDDRSVDFRIEERLAAESHFLPASSIDEQSRPVVHSVFHGLVSQLERYRQMVDNFDQYLMERRQGLLFNENLTDALTLAIDFEGGAMPKSTATLSATGTAVPELITPRPKPKAKSASSTLVSFLTPKKNKSQKTLLSEPTTPPRGADRAVDASPFGPHYQKTGAIVVEPFAAPAPSSGPWTPKKSRRWNADEEDVFGSSAQWGESRFKAEHNDEELESTEDERQVKPASVTLSRLLDNVVILEESIKELVAIIHARRSLGIDSIRYL